MGTTNSPAATAITAAAIGRKGGLSKSPAKQRASRENGAWGGKPMARISSNSRVGSGATWWIRLYYEYAILTYQVVDASGRQVRRSAVITDKDHIELLRDANEQKNHHGDDNDQVQKLIEQYMQ
jgi:hypothetical protein